MNPLKSRAFRVVLAVGLLAVIGVGVMVMSSRSTSAAVKPQCGPASVWDCTLPNGTHKTVGGTICDITKYQQQTGARCVPSPL